MKYVPCATDLVAAFETRGAADRAASHLRSLLTAETAAAGHPYRVCVIDNVPGLYNGNGAAACAADRKALTGVHTGALKAAPNPAAVKVARALAGSLASAGYHGKRLGGAVARAPASERERVAKYGASVATLATGLAVDAYTTKAALKAHKRASARARREAPPAALTPLAADVLPATAAEKARKAAARKARRAAEKARNGAVKVVAVEATVAA